MHRKKIEIKALYLIILVFFMIFLISPLFILFINSFREGDGFGLSNYILVFSSKEAFIALKNSLKISLITASITTTLAFLLAYGVNCTNFSKRIKKVLNISISIPMLLPTITYGFVIMYSFGKEGLITKLLGREVFEIYGFNGLLIGYLIYTLPSAFLLINNSFQYIDKKFILVSKLMGDRSVKSFFSTIIRPLIGTLSGSFLLSFVLSFTDFGIPASLGGTYNVISTKLYEVMLGSMPNFELGAAIAIFMLIPSAIGILLLGYLEKFDFHYDKISKVELNKNKFRDLIFATFSILIVIGIVSIFIVMFIVPFVNAFPYDMSFTTKFLKEAFESNQIIDIFKNSCLVAFMTALLGTFISYVAALINVRTNMGNKEKKSIDIFSMITNTVPGMVLGLAYLFLFNKSDLKGTFTIIVLCNIVHFFTTPYMMAKSSLSKMNQSWETTAELLGDSWGTAIFRVVIPNSILTIIDMISYYFINSMVTISAIIFLITARTTLITSKIKEFQHYGDFNKIFILSILVFITNIIVRVFSESIKRSLSEEKEKVRNKKLKFLNRKFKTVTSLCIIFTLILGFISCGNRVEDKIIIYTNADDEAIEFIKESLDSEGYDDLYIVQPIGTSELGGKLLAEGENMEADIVTMSSYFLESAQIKHNMFETLDFKLDTLEEYPDFYLPILSNTATMFINTNFINDKGLEVPKSFKDLTKEEYKGLISIPNIMNSSTGWLLVQGVIGAYGEEEGKEIMNGIINNSESHIESSGSAPLKKVSVGEVAIGFGLRHQAILYKKQGKAIDFVDPLEGNYSLTEAVAVLKKDDKDRQELSMRMTEVILNKARKKLINNYPIPLYKGEIVEDFNKPSYPKKFEKNLTAELLNEHQEFFNKSK